MALPYVSKLMFKYVGIISASVIFRRDNDIREEGKRRMLNIGNYNSGKPAPNQSSLPDYPECGNQADRTSEKQGPGDDKIYPDK